MIRALVCRLFGRSCTPRHPSRRDLVAELRARKAVAEAEAAAIRERRRVATGNELVDRVRGYGR